MDSHQRTGHTHRVSGQVWRFAEFEFDELRHELRVRGTPVDVEAKPLEVLHQLLVNAGEVVTKDELLESVWPGLMVVDGSLATAVSKLRKALGSDDAVVVTIPRVGYRLAVPVHSKAADPPEWPDLHLESGQPVPGRDQWRLTRRLDLSLSSEVWLAEHPKTHEARVFKFAPDAVRLKGLKREVTIARLLRESLGERPEFVRVLEWNFDSPPYFIETEYAGPNLAEWVELQGGLGRVPLELRLRLVVDVALAVAAAHDVEVLHKDLKPANILMSEGPEGGAHIKVADFGSASLLAPWRLGALGITNLGFTHTGQGDSSLLTGTVMYVAPEVLGGQSPTRASDVYALGVLLYQVVVCDFRKPLAPGWEAEIADPLLCDDIAEAACGDPARRFKTAQALVERLRNLDDRRHESEERARVQQNALLAQRKRADARIRRPWLVLAGVALLVAAAMSLSVYRKRPSVPPVVRTVAVLPFQNVDSDQSIDFLRLALPDEIATILSHTRSLSVRPFATTSNYHDAIVDLQKAGREVRATAIVTGHFLRAGEQLQITLEAIDVGANHLLWRDTFAVPAGSLIAAHVQLVARARGGLAPALGSSATDTAAPPKNEEAYDLFLRSAAFRFDTTPNKQGMVMLESAVALDPTYAPAWFALARRYYVEARYTNGTPAMMERYETATKRALAVDPNYIAAGNGLILSRVERGDLVEAYRAGEDLVRRRPDNADAHFGLSYVLRYAGLLEESAKHCETAFFLDPQTPNSGLRSCAVVFLLSSDYARGMKYISLDLGSEWAKALSIHMLVRQNKEQEALRIGSPHIPHWGSYDMLLACVERRPLPDILRLAEAVQPSDDPETNYFFAAHLAYCGQSRAALEMLKQAIQGKYCSFPAIDSDPYFTGLRSKTEFADVRSAAMACQRDFLAHRGQGLP